MKTIPVNDGLYWALVDDQDYEYLLRFPWRINNKGYPNAAVKGAHATSIFMHQAVYLKPIPEGYELHHKDGNKLNNQRDNIEAVTRAYNQQRKAVQANNTSGYKGVCFNKQRNKWQANISLNGKTKNLGRFNSPEDAAKAYDIAAQTYFGKDCFLNFPPTLCPSTTSSPQSNNSPSESSLPL